MSRMGLYTFFLCLIVFISITALFGAMLAYIIKMSLKTIRHGLEDERITIEYQKELQTKPAVKIANTIFSCLVFAVLLVAFILSLFVQLSDDKVKGNLPTAQIVLSDSMSFKHDSNTYLAENQLDDQFNTFDLIWTHKLPGEFELELYDIVVYEYHGELIIHRIVGIEEPNEDHPDHRAFLLRGDAVKWADEFPVLYEQMKAIYKGERVAFIGSFFTFMQSPAGYLCILLVVFSMVVTPIVEKKLWTEKRARLMALGVISEELPSEELPSEEDDNNEKGTEDEEQEEQEEVEKEKEVEV